MNIRIKLFLLIVSTIALANKGIASNNEGVYIADKESVVFFSESFKIVNLRNEEKIDLYSCAINYKKDVKIAKKNRLIFPSKIYRKYLKKEDDIIIPLKHVVFNVKNIKKFYVSLLQSKETNNIFYFSVLTNSFFYKNVINSNYIIFNYIFQKQLVRNFGLNDIRHIFQKILCILLLYSLLGIFFYTKIREKSKIDTYILKRGPPISI